MSTVILPRKQSSESDVKSTFAALSDLQDKARRTPDVQFKTFTIIAGTYPVKMNTWVRGEMCVTVGGVWLVSNPSTAVYCTGISWTNGDTDGDIDVLGLNGLTSGTKYRVRIKIEGM